jgi:hypothetical protein
MCQNEEKRAKVNPVGNISTAVLRVPTRKEVIRGAYIGLRKEQVKGK